MPKSAISKLAIALIVAATAPAFAQDSEESGWGIAPVADHVDELSDEQYREIQERLDRNAKMLREAGVLPEAPPHYLGVPPPLDWPLRAPKLKDPGFHTTWVFVDQNPSYPNALLDYSCGNRTYDTAAGYNHGGTDYITWPFQWLRQAQEVIEVVAAASGTILGKDDGHPDQSCVNDPSAPWNAVYIQHPDGSIAWYGHLQIGSLTTKPVGATVAKGEYLGLVGSAGNSSASHLHFEVYSDGFRNDPYQGACNSMNASTWWASQRPYNDSALNRFATAYAAPVFPGCPEIERPNEAWDFNPGDRAFFVTYYREQLAGQASTHVIRRPDGTVYATWGDNPSSAFERSVYWFRSFLFASNVPLGIWRYEVTALGKTYARTFRLSAATAGSGRVPGELLEDTPVTVNKSGASVTLAWDASCVPTDTDYEIYQGTIGDWTSHTPVTCSTSGARTSTFMPSSGSAYYLVVPHNGSQEGSYGWNGQLVERPLGLSSCRSKVIGGSCPRCGDNTFESPEVCDRQQLNGQTCQSQGFADGILGCATNCQAFDTAGCF